MPVFTDAMHEPNLSHSSDAEPGIRRRKHGKGFRYVDAGGRSVGDANLLKRIGKLAIPPAWTDVWICAEAAGHIQATGRDARGRKQYIYHPAFRAWREESKFRDILKFGAALPRLRARVAEDLATAPVLSRRAVLAAAVRVLERTLMRVGNEEYARQNHSYGLTTLRRRHIDTGAATVRFRFRAKSGKEFSAAFSDRRVAAILRRLEGLPGQHLLKFVGDDCAVHRIVSDDVNGYIREATGGDFSAKDMRTWAATVFAATELMAAVAEAGDLPAPVKAHVKRAVERTSQRLSNTPAVCRKSYIHPQIIEAYTEGTLIDSLRRSLQHAATTDDPNGLSRDEAAVLRFLKRRLNVEPAMLTNALARSVEAALPAA